MLNLLASRELGVDSPACVFHAETALLAHSLDLSKYHDFQKIHRGGINSLDLDPVDNRYLLSGGGEGIIGLHDLHNTTGVPQCTFPTICTVGLSNRYRHKFSVETVKWYPLDTGMFISSGTDKHLKVWDTNSLTTADEYEFSGVVYSHDVSSIATKHCLIAVGYLGNSVRLLDLRCGSSIHTLKGHRSSVLSVQWSTRNEYLLATGSQDSKAMLWDIRRANSSLMMLDQHNGDASANPNSVNTAHDGHVNGLCFTPDGLHLVTFGTDERLRLWCTATGRNMFVNYGRINNKCRKSITLAMSHDSKPEIVYVPSDNNIGVYGLFSGTKLGTLRGHFSQVNCCVRDANTQHLYSAGNDRNILLWLPQTDTVRAYEAHLTGDSNKAHVTRFTQRIAATADAWSSDDD
ncbi:hypothetical protein NP493_500g00000 [Ridgeia piscesae]|uniref:DNA excision repair protein ERCC-8 n=1 Tax=Ridgeia piscesae TaxID=27915 RepID=A0AAD9NQQ2_RIDPI|nr:hypothetical protein NP493_500g00000 [Ridgeia piscesae]